MNLSFLTAKGFLRKESSVRASYESLNTELTELSLERRKVMNNNDHPYVCQDPRTQVLGCNTAMCQDPVAGSDDAEQPNICVGLLSMSWAMIAGDSCCQWGTTAFVPH
nr:uncharacterized protein LOC128689996 [Cherax quadricarinatus]